VSSMAWPAPPYLSTLFQKSIYLRETQMNIIGLFWIPLHISCEETLISRNIHFHERTQLF
jgi:hypothetical protein